MFLSKDKWEERKWHDKYFMTIIGSIMWIVGLIGIILQVEFIEFNAVMLFAGGTVMVMFDGLENPNLK